MRRSLAQPLDLPGLYDAEELGLEIIDVYHDFFPHEEWESKDLYTRDGLHPNEAGREKIARRIAEVLSREPRNRTDE